MTQFEVLESTEIYNGKVFDFYRESVRYPDGRVAGCDFIRHGGAVSILPLDEDRTIWFVRQYRHPVGGLLLELPAGTLEDGESPEVCAAREVREEIGMAAERLEEIGAFYLAPGYSTEFMHIFLATGLFEAPLEQDDNEYIQVEKYPVEQVYRMAEQGEIKDCKTLAILALAQPHLLVKKE
jgi:ADP-ribose pyrophosphatase